MLNAFMNGQRAATKLGLVATRRDRFSTNPRAKFAVQAN